MSDNKSRSLRAILRTAATWAAAWAVAGGTIVGVIRVFDPNPAIDSLIERLGLAAFSGVAWGVRFGIAGAVMGTAFSSVIRLGYRGRRLADINPVRFALLGAVVGGVGVPLYLQAMNILTDGHPIAWGLVTDDAIWATVFGAAAAAGSILLARRADARSATPDPDRLERVDDPNALPAGAEPEATVRQRSGSTTRSSV